MPNPVSNYKGQEEQICNRLFEKLCELGVGTETSIFDLLPLCYGQKDSVRGNFGALFWIYKELVIEDFEQMDVLDRLEKKCKKHGYKLDFSKHDGMVTGVPYNLNFVFKQKRRKLMQNKDTKPKAKHSSKNEKSADIIFKYNKKGELECYDKKTGKYLGKMITMGDYCTGDRK